MCLEPPSPCPCPCPCPHPHSLSRYGGGGHIHSLWAPCPRCHHCRNRNRLAIRAPFIVVEVVEVVEGEREREAASQVVVYL